MCIFDQIVKLANYFFQGERPIELIKLIGTAGIAYFTITWSLKRFFKERQWEKRSEAYSRIIEALHHMKRTNTIWLDNEMEGKNLSDEKARQLHAQHTAANDELKKYIEMGIFYISEDVLSILRKLQDIQQGCMNDWNQDATSLFDIYDREAAACKDCLESIKAIAIKELHK